MKRNLLKTMLVAVGMVAGMSGAWAQDETSGVWTTIFSEDYNDANTYNKFWTSANTGRYTVNQTKRPNGEDGDYVMEIVPVGNGDNGTTVTYTGLTSDNSAVASYQTSEQYRITFDFNFSTSNNQAPFFQLFDSNNSEIVGFYNTAYNSTDGSIRLRSNGSATEGTELGTIALQKAMSVPTTYYTVVIYTKDNATYMMVKSGDEDILSECKIDDNVIHIGKLTHNTKRYYNHFGFDNLKVELYADKEIVTAPEAAISAINGKERTVTITSQGINQKIFYYIGDDDSNPTEYLAPIVIKDSSTLHYYAQSQSGAKSDVQNLEIKCEDVILVAPTIIRTGANSYTLTATQLAVDGLTAVPTIYYTVAGGEEKIVPDNGNINDVIGNIAAWAVAEGYTTSATTTMEYVPAYQTTEVWTIDVNSIPSKYYSDKETITTTDIIDENTEKILNGKTFYNLKYVNSPDFYIENTDGWLFRNRTSNAFKIQSSAASIIIDNVNTNNVICITARDDYGRYRINSVVNGSVKYSYNNSEYFIVPEVDGAVTVTFGTGVSLNTVSVNTLTESLSVGDAGLATFCSNYALDFTNVENIWAYRAELSGDKVMLVRAKGVVNAGEGILLRSLTEDAQTANVPVTSESSTERNDFVGTVDAIHIDPTTEDNNTNYVLAKVNGELCFSTIADGGITLRANSAYLPVPSSTAKSIKMVFGDDVTGINDVKTDAVKDNEVFYTLSGVRVLNPTKGLYIQNGKKVVIK